MNITQKKNNRKINRAAEIEQLAHEQGVEPFNFDEAMNDRQDEWTEKDEKDFEGFMKWRQEIRQAQREAQKKQWQS